MSAAASVAKASPAIAAVPLLTIPPFDPAWAIVIPVGLAAAAMARLATVVDDAEPWARVRKDLVKSAMISGGNAISAAVIIRAVHADYLLGLGIAFGFGFGGVQTLSAFWNRAARAWAWFRNHAIEDAGAVRQAQQKIRAAEAILRERDLREKAERLDHMIEDDER